MSGKKEISHWNYRVFRTRYQTKVLDETYEEDYYNIREVYWATDGTIFGITEKSLAGGETLKELQDTLQQMLSDSTWPVITPRDVPGYTYEPGEIVIPDEELDA